MDTKTSRLFGGEFPLPKKKWHLNFFIPTFHFFFISKESIIHDIDLSWLSNTPSGILCVWFAILLSTHTFSYLEDLIFLCLVTYLSPHNIYIFASTTVYLEWPRCQSSGTNEKIHLVVYDKDLYDLTYSAMQKHTLIAIFCIHLSRNVWSSNTNWGLTGTHVRYSSCFKLFSYIWLLVMIVNVSLCTSFSWFWNALITSFLSDLSLPTTSKLDLPAIACRYVEY